MGEAHALRAFVNGEELEEPAARALWERFSAYLESHPGDEAGFAVTEGRRFATACFVRGAGAAVLELGDTPPLPRSARRSRGRRQR